MEVELQQLKRDLCERWCREGMEWRKTGAQKPWEKRRSGWSKRNISPTLLPHSPSSGRFYSIILAVTRPSLSSSATNKHLNPHHRLWSLRETRWHLCKHQRSGWLHWSLPLLLSSPCEYKQRRKEYCYFNASVTLLFHPAVWETSFTVVISRGRSEKMRPLISKDP